jgi:antitoxin YefM
MDTLSYTSFRKNLAGILDKVNEDHVPVMITRQSGEAAIVMSLEDFKSYEETSYLMASPKNAMRLNTSISELEAGNMTKHDLIET